MAAAPLRPPKVTVITAVYNGAAYVAAAVESILAQTFTDFEYLLVDDASTDNSAALVAEYVARDPRLTLLRNTTNCNVSGALNRALAAARGDYLAILDQDDLAYPGRLAQQVAFLDAHPGVGVVGAQAESMDAAGRVRHPMRYPTTPVLARWALLHQSPVLHSAALLRRTLVEAAGGYSLRRWYANDYLLLSAISRCADLVNLPATLVAYRRHPQQTASRYAKAQSGQVWLLIHSLIAERMGLQIPLGAIGCLYLAVRGQVLSAAGDLLQAADLLDTLHARFFAVEAPDAATRAEIDRQVALRRLFMAWTHRHLHRPAARALAGRARALDPQIWQRPQTWTLLRRYRRPGAPTPQIEDAQGDRHNDLHGDLRHVP